MSAGEKDLAVQLLDLRVHAAFDRGVDMQSRNIQIVGDIDQEMFCFVDAALTLLEDGSRKQITIKLNSHGGAPSDALAIIARIKQSTCLVVCEAYGVVASAATMILAACKKRKISEFCQLMTHQSSYIVEGTHKQIKEATEQAEREEKIWATYLARFSSRDANYWYELHKTGIDKYFTAQDCMALGLADEIF